MSKRCAWITRLRYLGWLRRFTGFLWFWWNCSHTVGSCHKTNWGAPGGLRNCEFCKCHRNIFAWWWIHRIVWWKTLLKNQWNLQQNQLRHYWGALQALLNCEFCESHSNKFACQTTNGIWRQSSWGTFVTLRKCEFGPALQISFFDPIQDNVWKASLSGPPAQMPIDAKCCPAERGWGLFIAIWGLLDRVSPLGKAF